jgi:uncharacterized membrane protein
MIDVDNPSLIMLIPIIIVFVAPFIYSFFVDNYDKDKPQIKT